MSAGSLATRLAVLCALFAAISAAVEPGARVAYVGGTVAGVGNRIQGLILMTDDDCFSFQAKAMTVQIPYENINLLEYGQKASRRYAMAIVISPMLLLSKKRNHFLTVGFTDEQGKQQALVFQLDKNDVRAVLAGLEARTGLKVQHQDDEARKGKG
ncbi:MAG TPA: hypothetical protein VLE22_14400 [Bryobacteraceae bacterium]|nr:hypothetical protein [Bryobacteraceae bacterium]